MHFVGSTDRRCLQQNSYGKYFTYYLMIGWYVSFEEDC